MELLFWDRGTALPALSIPQAVGGAQGRAGGARHGGSRGRARQRGASRDSAVSHPAPKERRCSCKHRPGQSHQAKRGHREDPEQGTGTPSSLPCLHPLPQEPGCPLPLEEFAFFPGKRELPPILGLLWRLSTTRSLPEPGWGGSKPEMAAGEGLGCTALGHRDTPNPYGTRAPCRVAQEGT